MYRSDRRRGRRARSRVGAEFGSSLLSDAAGFRLASDEIRMDVSLSHRVLAVVSAMRGTTDRLLDTATQLSDPPAGCLLSSLLKTGEDASGALLGIALTAEGVHAHALLADALGLRTCGPLHDAEPIGADLVALETCLRAHEVVVVPGYVGDRRVGVALLGRGGSDLTALFLAAQLGAEEVRLVKDVDGVHRWDPKAGDKPSDPLDTASWSEVERIGNGVVQGKALRYAERYSRVQGRCAGRAGDARRTGGFLVSTRAQILDGRIPVAVLGATGIVGQHLIQRLSGHPTLQLAEVVGSADRAGARYGSSVNWVVSAGLPTRPRGSSSSSWVRPGGSGLR